VNVHYQTEEDYNSMKHPCSSSAVCNNFIIIIP